MVRLADQAAFPIVVIPRSCPLDDVLSQAERFAQQKCGTNPVTVRLLVHVHGGLNGFEGGGGGVTASYTGRMGVKVKAIQ